MRLILFPVALTLLLTACGGENASQSRAVNPGFSSKDARYIHTKGNVRIDGEAFIINKAGRVVFAAGETIRLVPATPYASARFARLYRGRTFIAASAFPRTAPNPEYASYTRTTISSARGKFFFDDVSRGEYFITAQKIIRPPGALIPIGGAMYAKVKIMGNEQRPVKVVVAGK